MFPFGFLGSHVKCVFIKMASPFVPVLINDEYERFSSKRLRNSVIKTVMTSSVLHCTTWCSLMDGCLAVNVIGIHDITCELTTGLSNEMEMEDDSSSELFVSSKGKKSFVNL